MSDPMQKLPDPLSRSSVEFSFGFILAIILGVYTMTWWLRVFLIIIVGGVVIHLIFRSPLTLAWRRFSKVTLSLVAMLLLMFISWNPMNEQWVKDHPIIQSEQKPTTQTIQPKQSINMPTKPIEQKKIHPIGGATKAQVDDVSSTTEQDIPEVQKILPSKDSFGTVIIGTIDNPRRICKNHPVDDFSRQLNDKLKISVLAAGKENNKQIINGILSTVHGEQETKLEKFTSVQIGTCMIYEIYSIRVSDIFSDYDCAVFQVSLNEIPPCKQPK